MTALFASLFVLTLCSWVGQHLRLQNQRQELRRLREEARRLQALLPYRDAVPTLTTIYKPQQTRQPLPNPQFN